MANLLVLGVHSVVCLHGGSVFLVEGGIPVPSYDHGLPHFLVYSGMFMDVLVHLFLRVGFNPLHVYPKYMREGVVKGDDDVAQVPN